MATILIPITFVLIFILVYKGKLSSLKEVYIKSILFLSVATIVITELLSLLNLINSFAILISWLLLFTALSMLAWQRKLAIKLVGKEILSRITAGLQNT